MSPPQGVIYAIPLHADGILKIVPETGEVTEVGCIKGKDKWEGGVVADDGAMYCLPLRAKNVLKIDPTRGKEGAPKLYEFHVAKKVKIRVGNLLAQWPS
jgi:hypothetical protein